MTLLSVEDIDEKPPVLHASNPYHNQSMYPSPMRSVPFPTVTDQPGLPYNKNLTLENPARHQHNIATHSKRDTIIKIKKTTHSDSLAMVGAYDPYPSFWPGVQDVIQKRKALGRPIKDEWQRMTSKRFDNIKEVRIDAFSLRMPLFLKFFF